MRFHTCNLSKIYLQWKIGKDTNRQFIGDLIIQLNK